MGKVVTMDPLILLLFFGSMVVLAFFLSLIVIVAILFNQDGVAMKALEVFSKLVLTKLRLVKVGEDG